eukprot:11713031-Alexandrium_andersonii.AAC.1
MWAGLIEDSPSEDSDGVDVASSAHVGWQSVVDMEGSGASLGASSSQASQAGQALEPLPLGDQAPEVPEPSAGRPQLQRKRSIRCNSIAK